MMDLSKAHELVGALLASMGLVFSSGALSAQRTWIVDSANGTGTDYIDLDPAVAAAGAGDTILVRPGLTVSGVPYSLLRDITRGLRIVAPGTGAILVDTRGRRQITIPDTEMLIMDNLRFVSPSGFAGFTLYNCRGTVVLSRLHQEWWDYSGVGSASQCTRVVWTDCSHTAPWGTTISAHASKAYVLDSRMECIHTGNSLSWPIPTPTITVGTPFTSGAQPPSTAWIVNSYVKGGDIGQFPNWNPPMPALDVQRGCRAVVAGRSEFVGGWGSARTPGLRVFGDAGRPQDSPGLIALDPLTICDGPRETQGGRLEYVHEMPTVSPDDALRGQPQAIRMIGPSNGIMALFASLLTARPPLSTPIGDLWLDPATTVLIGGGAADANRNLVLSTTIPSWLQSGEVFVYQAIAATPSNWLELSPPGFAVVQ